MMTRGRMIYVAVGSDRLSSSHDGCGRSSPGGDIFYVIDKNHLTYGTSVPYHNRKANP